MDPHPVEQQIFHEYDNENENVIELVLKHKLKIHSKGQPKFIKYRKCQRASTSSYDEGNVSLIQQREDLSTNEMHSLKRKCDNDVSRPTETVYPNSVGKKMKLDIQGESDSRTNGSEAQSKNYNLDAICKFEELVDSILNSAEENCLNRISDAFQYEDEHTIDQETMEKLCSEAKNLKQKAVMHSVPLDKLVLLMNILEQNVNNAEKSLATKDFSNTMGDIIKAADACLVLLCIMTSPNMPRRIYMEKFIERIISYMTLHSQNITLQKNTSEKVQVKNKGSKNKSRTSLSSTKTQAVSSTDVKITKLNLKLLDLIILLADLLDFQILGEIPILNAASIAISQVFNNYGINFYSGCLKLLRVIFIHYENQRKIILGEMLSPACHMNNVSRTYELYNGECINIFTALILDLIQSVIPSYERIKKKNISKSQNILIGEVISKEYEKASECAVSFFVSFLNRCDLKSAEVDYKRMFVDFLRDTLTTLNKPEWPASVLLLNVLGNILMRSLSNNVIAATTKIISLGCLGLISAKLVSESKKIQPDLVDTLKMFYEDGINKSVISKPNNLKSEKMETYYFQNVLLNYLIENSRENESFNYAGRFYIAHWYKYSLNEETISTSVKDEQLQQQEVSKTETAKKGNKVIKKENKITKGPKLLNKTEDEHYILHMFKSFPEIKSMLNNMKSVSNVEYTCAENIVKYLAQKIHSLQELDHYLKAILIVLKESSIQIRTKAVNSLDMIVEADPSILENDSIGAALRYSFIDQSATVRESVIDLVGKAVLKEPKLINVYYKTLSARLLDASVSVRKKAIRVLGDICLEYTELSIVPELLYRIARRIGDGEETVQKSVIEMFIKVWFSLTRDDLVLKKVMLIINVITMAKDECLDRFRNLFKEVLKPENDNKDNSRIKTESSVEASKQIIKCLVENILNSEGNPDQKLIGLIVLHLFAEAKPDFLKEYIHHFQPFLTMQFQSANNSEMMNIVIKIIQLVLSSTEKPNILSLSQLEEHLMKLSSHHDQSIINSCFLCLSTVLRVTKNFFLIRGCFKRYFIWLKQFKNWIETGHIENLQNAQYQLHFKSASFRIGLLFYHFDFKDSEVTGDLSANVVDDVFRHLLYFLKKIGPALQYNVLKAIGYMCTKYHEYMLDNDLKTSYLLILRTVDVPVKIKLEVLNNIGNYLIAADNMMTQRNKDWNIISESESLKEMADVTSGMSSVVMQFYVQEILDLYINLNLQIRQSCARLIQTVIFQGLMHPVKVVPYVICMSTDPEKEIKLSADKMLSLMSTRNFIHMRAHVGVELSYKLQKKIAQNDIVRGFHATEGGVPVALNAHLYSVLRNVKLQRRALILTFLKQFDRHSDSSLSYLLYLADNLAYFPYVTHDEPLFVLHRIDVMMSLSGTELMKSLQKLLFPKKEQRNESCENVESDETLHDEEVETSSTLEDTNALSDHLNAMQKFILLLTLKQYLKSIYGFNDTKIQEYSASDENKIYAKNLTRKNTARFAPDAAVKFLKDGLPIDDKDKNKRKVLISQYLNFKKLMLHFDLKESDEN